MSFSVSLAIDSEDKTGEQGHPAGCHRVFTVFATTGAGRPVAPGQIAETVRVRRRSLGRVACGRGSCFRTKAAAAWRWVSTKDWTRAPLRVEGIGRCLL